MNKFSKSIISIIFVLLVGFGIAFASSPKVRSWTYDVLKIKEAQEETLVNGYTIEEAEQLLNLLSEKTNKLIEKLELVDTDDLNLKDKVLLVDAELQEVISDFTFVENTFNSLILEMAGVDVSSFTIEEKINYIIEGFEDLLSYNDSLKSQITNLYSVINNLQELLNDYKDRNYKVLYAYEDFKTVIQSSDNYTSNFGINGISESIDSKNVYEIIFLENHVVDGKIMKLTVVWDNFFSNFESLEKITICGDILFDYADRVVVGSLNSIKEIDARQMSATNFIRLFQVVANAHAHDFKLILSAGAYEKYTKTPEIVNWAQNQNVIIEVA